MRAHEFTTESKVADIKRLARAAAKKFKAGDESQANNPHPTDSYLGKVWKETFNKMLTRIPDEPIAEREMFPDVRTFTPQDIAKKHNVSVQQIMSQLQKGIKVEYEHTKDKNASAEIALDHLLELPDYYDRLEKMER